MSPRTDVFQMEADKLRQQVRQLAIFTPRPGTLANQATLTRVHVSFRRDWQPEFRPGSKLDERQQLLGFFVGMIFVALTRGQRALFGLFCEPI